MHHDPSEKMIAYYNSMVGLMIELATTNHLILCIHPIRGRYDLTNRSIFEEEAILEFIPILVV
jgi:hypothetical protein